MTLAFNPDWNSFISALIGGGLALLGTFITLKGTKKQREKVEHLISPVIGVFCQRRMSLLCLDNLLRWERLSKIMNNYKYKSRWDYSRVIDNFHN